MIRAVIDANVFVSGVLGIRNSVAAPSEVLRRWRGGAFRAITSPALIDEILRTLYESHFVQRILQFDRIQVLTALFKDAEQCVFETPDVRIASHPEDDLILATAVAGKADVLITGDKQLLRLGEHRGVRIVTARAFLAILDAEGSIPAGDA